MFTGSNWGDKLNFLGANGLLAFSMVYELIKEKKKKHKQNNKSNKTCSLTISLLQVNFLLMRFSKMTPLKV